MSNQCLLKLVPLHWLPNFTTMKRSGKILPRLFRSGIPSQHKCTSIRPHLTPAHTNTHTFAICHNIDLQNVIVKSRSSIGWGGWCFIRIHCEMTNFIQDPITSFNKIFLVAICHWPFGCYNHQWSLKPTCCLLFFVFLVAFFFHHKRRSLIIFWFFFLLSFGYNWPYDIFELQLIIYCVLIFR